MPDRDPLEWLRRIVVKGHPSGTVGGEIRRHGIIVKVLPALLDVAEEVKRHRIVELMEVSDDLDAAIREQMERAK